MDFSAWCQDALSDTVKLFPFLLISYCLIEYFEWSQGERTENLLKRAGKYGPLIAALAGVLPQCGFSAVAADFFSEGLITEGTLLSVFLSTSDEMLPIFLSEKIPYIKIVLILLLKLTTAFITGMLFDMFFSGKANIRTNISGNRKKEGVGLAGLLRESFIHTARILLVIFIFSLFISLVFQDDSGLRRLFSGSPFLGIFLAGLIGLIPNCVSSVILTELYVSSVISFPQLFSGLLVGAGAGLLVLFDERRDFLKNLRFTGTLYFIGVFWGIMAYIIRLFIMI